MLANDLQECEKASRECIMIPHFPLLGGKEEVCDIGKAIRKVQRFSRDLANSGPRNNAT
jgi:hypothetical protein